MIYIKDPFISNRQSPTELQPPSWVFSHGCFTIPTKTWLCSKGKSQRTLNYCGFAEIVNPAPSLHILSEHIEKHLDEQATFNYVQADGK